MCQIIETHQLKILRTEMQYVLLPPGDFSVIETVLPSVVAEPSDRETLPPVEPFKVCKLLQSALEKVWLKLFPSESFTETNLLMNVS